MRFYTGQHNYYCGIDLHARTMYVCIISQDGTVLVEKNIPARPGPFLELIAPYRDDLIVAVECIFTWYWLADLCHEKGIHFVLGHALYMKAIRRESEERPDRRRKDRGAAPRRNDSAGLCLPQSHAIDA